jgi:hypothetical protein
MNWAAAFKIGPARPCADSFERRTRLRAIILFVAALTTITCGGSRPAPGPTTPTPPPTPHWTLTGTVLATGSSAPVAGATIRAGQLSATTDTSGSFTLGADGAQPSVLAVVISAPGFLTRETRIALPKSNLTVDIIQDSTPFDLSFYRELARDGFEHPEKLQPLWRWTSNPTFYILTSDDDGRPINSSYIALLQEHLPRAFNAYTNGLYTPKVETGSTDRPEADGLIRVVLRRDRGSLDYCGRSMVGGPRGLLELNFDACKCSRTGLGLDVVWHEVGHAAGFFHVADDAAIVHTPPPQRCTLDPMLSMREQYHVGVMYRRPRMNRDVDVDPPTFAFLIPAERTQPTVICLKP